jgi:cobyrinic acid a,c-diamide synthase
MNFLYKKPRQQNRAEKPVPCPALIISAPRSGSGKTTVTLGLLAALRRRGVRVKAAKIGPDYIDPAFHEAATGHESINIDSWAMGDATLTHLLATASQDADLLILEGAMGLFDGVPVKNRLVGSASDIAARFGIPVLLVTDMTGQSQSAGATVHGFASFNPDVRLAGIVLNRVGSPRHRELVSNAIEHIGIPVAGALTRQEGLVLPERHLGLVQAREHTTLVPLLNALADMAEKSLDIDAITASAKTPALPKTTQPASHIPPIGQRIALARDDAFSFVYPHILAGWRRQGAEIVPFSPLNDEAPPSDCDSCWLPGGYPELHAARLAQNTNFMNRLRAFAQEKPVHGECGGYMVLGRVLVDAQGQGHEMAGLLSHSTTFAKRKLHLGYRQACLQQTTALGMKGTVLRGHEFHYAQVLDGGNDAPFAALSDASHRSMGLAGGVRGHVSGTFFHVMACGEGHSQNL